jgi:pyruvate/2-oxoglutarate dehydrogenase complex dihydrolipoamide acyltransferase (E2) component
MTGNPDAPDAGRVPAAARPTDPPGEAGRPRSGPVTEFALVAAGLGLVVYLLGFVDDIGSSASLTGPLLLGGGLLAGSVALSTVGARVLVPAAVATVTGALLLLQDVVGGAGSGVAVGAAVLALFEAAAAAAAAFLHAGVVRAPRPRQRKPAAAPYPPQPGYPPFPGQQQFPGQYPGQYPGQQYPGQPQPGAYPGQPYPGSYPGRPGEPPPGDQYAGEHAYAQYARYGAQYGVPGYPPPPPYGAPGYDPSVPGAASPAAERAATPPPGIPQADQPTAVAPADPPRAAAPSPPGSLAPEATAVHRSGAHRATPAAAGEVAVTATGSHAAAPEAVDARPDGADDRTRAFPAVTDER